jgi:hypothetical protein
LFFCDLSNCYADISGVFIRHAWINGQGNNPLIAVRSRWQAERTS